MTVDIPTVGHAGNVGRPTMWAVGQWCSSVSPAKPFEPKTVLISDEAFTIVWRSLESDKQHDDELGPWFWSGVRRVRPEACMDRFVHIEVTGVTDDI